MSTHYIDQRKLTLKDWIAILIFGINVSALVWGASALNTTVSNLKETTDRLSHTVDQMVPAISSLQAQVSILLLRNSKIGPEP